MFLGSVPKQALLAFLILLSTIVVSLGDNYVTYGSSIVLRHVSSKFKLYSSKMSWGFGSRQQIVTAIGDNQYDDSGLWIIKPSHSGGTVQGMQISEPLENSSSLNVSTFAAGSPVKCGDIIRLEHMKTGKNLHSQKQNAAISGSNFEVSGYGKNGVGDTGDDFKVECSSSDAYWNVDIPIIFKHVVSNASLVTSKEVMFTESNCPSCPIVGHQEVSIQQKATTSKLAQWKAEPGLLMERHEDEDTNQYSAGKDEL